MTKADILRMLDRVPMNASVVFVSEPTPTWSSLDEFEHEVRAGFTVQGMRGLTVVLTDGRVPTAYEDVEGIR